VNDVVGIIVGGLALGCVYALVATGLVLTYKTSAVFNLALGAQAFTAAAVMYSLRNDAGLPMLVSFVVAVLIVGPLIGLGLYMGLFRFLRNVPESVRLVVALGVLVLLPSLVQGLFFGRGIHGNPPALVLEQNKVYSLGSLALPADQLSTIIITLLVVGGLTALFRFTNLGLQMRAVVESPRMVQLAGINSERISMTSWMLSGTIAALAGVLLAPLFGSVDSNNYTVLLVAAIAAAVFGRLTSLPLTLVGGLVLGFLQQMVSRMLPLDSVLATGLRPSLPFIVLFVLLLFWPGLRDRKETTDPLAGVDPPPQSLASRSRPVSRNLIAPYGLAAAVGVLLALLLPGIWLFRLTGAVVMAIIFLSFTVITGMAGQISLCQAAFAGAGGYAAVQLANHFNLPILVGLIAGAAVALVVGLLLAMPTLGLRGIYLTLATLAFTLMVEQIVFPLEQVGGGPAGLEAPRPYWDGFLDFSDDRAFFLLCVLILTVCGLVVALLKRGTTGRFLDAIRGSETGASSIGINPSRQKIAAFALSAAIAGVGGVLLASLQGRTSVNDFGVGSSLLWALVAVVIGTRTITGAVAGGFALVLLPEILKSAGVPNPEIWQGVVFGLLALSFVLTRQGLMDQLAEWFRRIAFSHAEPPEVKRRIVTIDLTADADAQATGPQAAYSAAATSALSHTAPAFTRAPAPSNGSGARHRESQAGVPPGVTAWSTPARPHEHPDPWPAADGPPTPPRPPLAPGVLP